MKLVYHPSSQRFNKHLSAKKSFSKRLKHLNSNKKFHHNTSFKTQKTYHKRQQRMRNIASTTSTASSASSSSSSSAAAIEKSEQEKEYISRLKQEAYADLHTSLQHYNNEFVERMRYMEQEGNGGSLSPIASTSSTADSSTSSEDSMRDLIDLFEAGSIKDYSRLIEWESYQTPLNYFEDQGEYGNLW